MSEYERNIALKESERNHCSDNYFKVRISIDTKDNRKIFEDGFDRAWDILTSGRKTDGKLIPATPFVQDSHVPSPPLSMDSIKKPEVQFSSEDYHAPMVNKSTLDPTTTIRTAGE